MSKAKKISWLEWGIVIAVVGILASILIPSYCDYRPRAQWAKAIAAISSLKLAIGECLVDNKGNQQVCNSIAKLDKYGIKAMPVLDKNLGKVEISAIDNRYPLSIRIVGDKELEGCQFAFIPAVTDKISVTWSAFFINSTDGSETKCLTRIKGSKSLPQL